MGSSGARAEAAGTVPPTKHNKEGRPKTKNLNSRSHFWQLSCRITFRMCIPTRVVSPAVTAGFLRANIARISKARPNPMSQQQHRRFTSMKPTNNSSTCKSNCKETPACPVVTYLSIVSVFSLIPPTTRGPRENCEDLRQNQNPFALRQYPLHPAQAANEDSKTNAADFCIQRVFAFSAISS